MDCGAPPVNQFSISLLIQLFALIGIKRNIHFIPLLRSNARHPGICKNASVEEFHNVERRPDNGLVFAEDAHPWNGDVCIA